MTMMRRIEEAERGKPWGYFGEATDRDPANDAVVGAALEQLVSGDDHEAHEFLASRMGRHLADAIHGVQERSRIETAIRKHLGWFRRTGGEPFRR